MRRLRARADGEKGPRQGPVEDHRPEARESRSSQRGSRGKAARGAQEEHVVTEEPRPGRAPGWREAAVQHATERTRIKHRLKHPHGFGGTKVSGDFSTLHVSDLASQGFPVPSRASGLLFSVASYHLHTQLQPRRATCKDRWHISSCSRAGPSAWSPSCSQAPTRPSRQAPVPSPAGSIP